jgi:hypothetical protein
MLHLRNQENRFMRPSFHSILVASIALAAAALWPGSLAAAPRADGQLQFVIVDAKTGQPIAARMHLTNTRGRPVRLRQPGLNQFGDHFYIDGQLMLPLRRGQFKFELEAGPEYRDRTGSFEIDRHADDTKKIEMHRFANLADEGWWAGDLDVTRRPEDLPLAMRAESLSIVPTRSLAPAHPQREKGKTAEQEEESPLLTIDGRRIARTPFAWDLPAWLAKDEVDAIALLHHHALRNGVVDNEADGRPRDRALFPGAIGNGRWSEAIYYHVLGCGLRVPPAAGSGSGENESPLGTNRVYVHCGEEFSDAAWWEGLEAGRVVVTNGPLLRPLVEGQPPGYVFHLEPGGRLSLEIGLELATRVPIEYLQIIKNGEPDVEVRLDEFAAQAGRLPPVVFDASGWFLVRAVTTNRKTYQFASSGPYYVEVADQPRVSRRSVEFFLDWITAAEDRLRVMPDIDEPSRSAQLAKQAAARQFFVDLLARANAD